MFQESLLWNITSHFTFRTQTFLSELSKNDYAKRDFLVKHHMYLVLDSLTFFPYCLSKSSFCLRKKLVELTLSGDGWLFWATTIIVKKINFREQSVHFICFLISDDNASKTHIFIHVDKILSFVNNCISKQKLTQMQTRK